MSSLEETPKVIKCIAVGDKSVGKTSLLLAYIQKSFPTENDLMNVRACYPSFESVTVKGASWTVKLYDTWTQEDYKRLRPLGYMDKDVFLVCFSVVLPSSVESLKTLWIQEITHYCPRTPYILVGTQIDLRDDGIIVEKLAQNDLKPVTNEEGRELAEKLKAVKYLECSVFTQVGLQELMEEAVLVARFPKRKRKQKCLIL